ncbi:ABC transporter permease [Dongia sp.]|uniref:ABC transporter permease n=1 Tax=Dongia sp. TaxID=1977262 RepID=UPI0035B20041
MNVAGYLEANAAEIGYLAWQHLLLFFLSLAAAVVLGVSLGVAVAKLRLVEAVAVPIMNVLQACPEIVLLAVSIPLLGIGFEGALIPLFVKGILPILRNTSSGIASVDRRLVEAARGLGLTSVQILIRIELPAALPIIISGVRIAAVMLISVLTLTAYIGVESLGTLIVRGIARMDTDPLIAGSLLTAILALAVNYLLVSAERTAARYAM